MRLRIGSGFGIPIYLHWTFFLLPLWVIYSYHESSPFSLQATLIGVPIVFVCVLLHEFGHALAARYFGIATQDVTLYPIGGVARLLKMPEKALEEIVIAVAGPAVNVVIAILLGCLMLAAGIMGIWQRFAGEVAWFVLGGNIALVAFNLLPIFPMDGGRVLRAFLAFFLDHYEATRIAAYLGIGLAILMGIAGLQYQLGLLPVLALFIIFAGHQELMFARMREHQRRRWEEEEPLEVLPVGPREPIVQIPQSPAQMLQPRVLVYTWDHQTGTWRQEPTAPA